MAARRPRRPTGSGSAESRPPPEAEQIGERESESPEMERARRYLDLWERNLTHLAVHGPAPDGGPRQ